MAFDPLEQHLQRIGYLANLLHGILVTYIFGGTDANMSLWDISKHRHLLKPGQLGALLRVERMVTLHTRWHSATHFASELEQLRQIGPAQYVSSSPGEGSLGILWPDTIEHARLGFVQAHVHIERRVTCVLGMLRCLLQVPSSRARTFRIFKDTRFRISRLPFNTNDYCTCP